MKRGTPRHPKLDQLSIKLNIPRYSAVGLLELLWHFAYEFAIAGDVGKFSDEVIAKALSYDGASTLLVSSLVDAGWLDRCECHRLRIHDWPEHADQTLRRVLENRNQAFIPCYDYASTVLVKTKTILKKNSMVITTKPPLDSLPVPVPIPIPHQSDVCAPARAREGPNAETVQHSEAEIGLRTIAAIAFGETINQWGEKPIYDHWLDEALPIPRQQFEACKWLYTLPEDHEIFTDKRNLAFTRRRQSFEGFMGGLKAECQKAAVVRKKWGGDSDEYRPLAWPFGMMQTFKLVWPEREPPEEFMQLCQTDREELLLKRKERNNQ